MGALIEGGIVALEDEKGRTVYRKDNNHLQRNFQSNPSLRGYQGSEKELGAVQAILKWRNCEICLGSGGVGGETIETDRKTGKLVICVLVEWVTRGRV
jgi:hypothetical protein